LMVLAAAAAATKTMAQPTSSSMNLFSSTTTQHHVDNTNSSDPIINYMTTGSTATPFSTTDLADERTFRMTMTTSLSPYFPYPRCDNTTLFPTSSCTPAARLACLAAVSSQARDVAAATPCRMESMLVDEQKCLMAMASVPSYSHPLFPTTTPSSNKAGPAAAGMSSLPTVITSSTPMMLPVLHEDTEERRFNVRWNDNEDERLKQAIELEGHAWTLIATKHFGNFRNKHQCKSRWSKVKCSQVYDLVKCRCIFLPYDESMHLKICRVFVSSSFATIKRSNSIPF
jgi:Myb-like DNA-binding domain